MIISTETHVIRGTANWAKVLGSPRLNEYTGEKEWSVDVTPDAEGRKLLRKLGLADRLREPKETDFRTESFLSFKQREFKANGEPSDPIRIVNANNEPWPEKTRIGNGSTVDVKFVKKDYGKGRKAGMYIRALRVLEHVPYVIQEFAPLDTDDEFFAGEESKTEEKPAKKNPLAGKVETVQDVLDDLDDEVPLL